MIKYVPSVLAIMFIAILAANRFITQSFSFGGLYFFEFLALSVIVFKYKIFITFLFKFQVVMVILLCAVIWLLLHAFDSGLDSLALRRSAVLVYSLIPLLLFVLWGEIDSFLIDRPYFFIIVGLFFLILNFDLYQPTMAAQLFGSLALFYFVLGGRYLLYSFVSFICFFLLASGLSSGESLYRLPVISFSVGFIVISYYKVRDYGFTAGFLFLFLALIFLFVLSLLIGVAQPLLGSLMIAIGGILNNDQILRFGLELGASQITTRGDGFGTAFTRVIFWNSIFDHQFNNINGFIFGNGVSLGFMEITLPDFDFRNKELIEPHNSFVGIFFKYGLIGFALFLYLIIIIFSFVSACVDRSKSMPFFVIAIIFASSEVALENPHGAILFWFIILLPLSFRDGYRGQSRIADEVRMKYG